MSRRALRERSSAINYKEPPLSTPGKLDDDIVGSLGYKESKKLDDALKLEEKKLQAVSKKRSKSNDEEENDNYEENMEVTLPKVKKAKTLQHTAAAPEIEPSTKKLSLMALASMNDEDNDSPFITVKTKSKPKKIKKITEDMLKSNVESDEEVQETIKEKAKGKKKIVKDKNVEDKVEREETVAKPVVKRAPKIVVPKNENDNEEEETEETVAKPVVKRALTKGVVNKNVDDKEEEETLEVVSKPVVKRAPKVAVNKRVSSLAVASPFDSSKILREVDSIVKRRKTTSMKLSLEDESLASELKILKERYNLLKNLRETEPEKSLKLFQTHAAEKEKAQSDLLNHWKSIAEGKASTKLSKSETVGNDEHKKVLKEVSTLKETIKRLEVQVNEVKKEKELLSKKMLESQQKHTAEAPISDFTREELVDCRKTISLFERMTSLSIQPDEIDPESWICIALNKNTKQAVKFTLKTPDHEGDWEFTPNGNVSLLPDFLQQAISFEVDQAPMFFSKIASALHNTDE